MPYPLPPGPPTPGEPHGEADEPTGAPAGRPPLPRPATYPPFPIEAPSRLRWPHEAHESRPKLPQIRGGEPEPERQPAHRAEAPDPATDAEPVPLPESTLPVGPEPVEETSAYVPSPLVGITGRRPVDTSSAERVGPRGSRRPGRRSGLLRMGLGVGISLGVLVACGIVIAAILARNDDAANTAAIPSFSVTPTPSPSAGLTSDPYATGPVSPGASVSPGVGPERLSKDDFATTWRLNYGNVQLTGQRIRSKDYKGCRATLKPKVAKGGCHYAVQMTYRAQHGSLRMTHLIFDFGTTDAAGKAADQLTADANAVNRHDGAALPGYKLGWFKAADYGKYVVFTMVTAKADVSEETGKQFTSYGNTDLGAAILFRL